MRLGMTGVALLGALVAGCNLAPPFHAPALALPATYQGSKPFRLAHPNAVLSAHGDWWSLLNDPELDALEAQLERSNPTLQAAQEAYTQARDLAAEAQSRLYPQLGATTLLSDNKQSAHRLFRGGGTAPNVEASNVIAAAASWEPDFWGAIRNRAHMQKQLAQASAADLATARLSLEAQLAADYIALRGLDAELAVLAQSILTYREALEVTRLRSQGGIASGLDLARAQSQLDATQAQETDVHLQRDLLQHALGALLGASLSDFSVAPSAEFRLTAPEIPAGLPSALLERRPDIASAERDMAAANAAIGVARAAFYPSISLGASGGYEDNGLNLLSAPNSLWSVGAGAVLPLFEGGLRRAELQRVRSAYQQTRDQYRATVLAAFQEVEDGLSLTQRLAVETVQQRAASEHATEALTISTLLYQDGLDNYLSVSVAQTQALAAQIVTVQARTRQCEAAVSLIRALGGGWTNARLPTEKEVLPFGPLDYHGETSR